jgi:hypothetical protein
MVLNAVFNNISVILWRSVLLVEETGVPEENHRPAASHWQTNCLDKVCIGFVDLKLSQFIIYTWSFLIVKV